MLKDELLRNIVNIPKKISTQPISNITYSITYRVSHDEFYILLPYVASISSSSLSMNRVICKFRLIILQCQYPPNIKVVKCDAMFSSHLPSFLCQIDFWNTFYSHLIFLNVFPSSKSFFCTSSCPKCFHYKIIMRFNY